MLKGENYCISAKNLLCHEFIGLSARVIESAHKSREKTAGTIVDETKNLFLIKTKTGVKAVPKKEAVFLVKVGNETVTVDGKKILVRPQERIKYFWRKN
ncbi:MAG: ribonuclease P protein subunit [Candidatus Diapherotrites archaeon]|nr:ribonuclease P protein subunit [Candidatus Diapherotrites archaeon]